MRCREAHATEAVTNSKRTMAMSDRYFVKVGGAVIAEREIWYVKQRVPDHEAVIVALCNQQDDAELVCAALNEYDARLLADLMAAKTVSERTKSNPESTPD